MTQLRGQKVESVLKHSKKKKSSFALSIKRESSVASSDPQKLLLQPLYTMDQDENHHDQPVSVTLTVASERKRKRNLEDRVHAESLKRKEVRRADRANHGTERSYPRHYEAYKAWFEADQRRQKEVWDEECRAEAEAQALARQEAGLPEPENLPPLEPYPYVSPEPINGTKVALFLNYEISREKRGPGGKTILPNTTVGVSSIKQTINSLEHYRFEHSRNPEYLADPESQIKLRDNPYIKAIEKSSQTGEAKRQEASQEMKAKGIVSATFTMEHLILMSTDYLRNPLGTSKRRSIMIALRNRAMLLFSTSMAFRGDNTRRILLSDLNVEDIPMPGREGPKLDRRVKALVVMSNQGKTNTTGRIDRHYALRHRDVDLCPLSALALYFFSLWQVFSRPVPNFEPSYTDARANGTHGYRAWYQVLLFPPLRSSKSDDTVPMAYENHRNQCNEQKARLGLEHYSSTHGGRSYTATTAIALGASTDSVRALGNWSIAGSWSLYNHSVPLDAMIAAAGCNGQFRESYFIAREAIVPPSDLLASIFPWVEAADATYSERLLQKSSKKDPQDSALKYLINLLRYLRHILIQDCAVLHQQHPDAPIFRYPPFNSDSFRTFAAGTAEILRNAEEHRRQRLQNLPQDIQDTFRGSMESTRIQVLDHQRRVEESTQNITSAIGALCNIMNTTIQVVTATTLNHAPPPLRRKAEESLRLLQSAAEDISASYGTKRPPLATSNQKTSILESTELAKSSDGISAHQSTSRMPWAPPATQPLVLIHTSPVQAASVASLGTSPPISQDTPLSLLPLFAPSASSISLSAPSSTSNRAVPMLVVSGLGTTFSDKVFPVSWSDAQVYALQIKALTELEQRYGDSKLKEHTFEWKNNEWLPIIQGLWKPPTISTGEPILETIYQDFKHGLDGKFSLDEIELHWRARWRTNNHTIRSELCRRNKAIQLIDDLAKLDQWGTDGAFRFLQETHPFCSKHFDKEKKCKIHTKCIDHFSNLRAFTTHLGKNDSENIPIIMSRARSYKFE